MDKNWSGEMPNDSIHRNIGLFIFLIGFLVTAFPLNLFAGEEPVPDFSYLNQSYPKGDKYDVKLGEHDSPKPFRVPAPVQKVFAGVLKEQWVKFVEFESLVSDSMVNHPEKLTENNLKDSFGPVIKIDLPGAFRKKELYVLRIKSDGVPFSEIWFLVFYDPVMNLCTSKPACIYRNLWEGYSFEDLLGDGKRELVVRTNVHNGSSWKWITRYYSCGQDLSVKEIFAFISGVNNQGAGTRMTSSSWRTESEST